MCKIADWIVCVMLGVCSVSDWKTKEIPVIWLVIMSIVIGILTVLCNAVSIRLRIGGVLLGMLFLLISKCTKEAIGYADSWLVLLLGLYAGGLQTMHVLFGASLLAAICSIFHLWRHHWKRSATLPFVPFLAISYLGAIVL